MIHGNTVYCDKCHRATATFERMDELKALGWYEAARAGKKREKWDWWCSACAPKGSTNMLGPTIVTKSEIPPTREG